MGSAIQSSGVVGIVVDADVVAMAKSPNRKFYSKFVARLRRNKKITLFAHLFHVSIGDAE